MRSLYKKYRRYAESLGLPAYAEYRWSNSRHDGVADIAIERYIHELYQTRRKIIKEDAS